MAIRLVIGADCEVLYDWVGILDSSGHHLRVDAAALNKVQCL